MQRRESRESKEFAWFEGLALCMAAIATQLSSEFMNQWGLYFYSASQGVGRTIYVAIELVWLIFLAGTLWDALTDPLIGAWSDKTAPRPGLLRLIRPRGRRRPFIFWGSIFMTFTAIAFWYPPVDGISSANLIYGTVLLCLHWTMFTVTVVPLIALGPEIARTKQARVRIGTWVAVGMIVGLALAAVAPGALIVQLDPARTEGGYSAIGCRRVAIVFAFVSLALFQLPVWLVKERHESKSGAREPAPFLRGLGDAVGNRPFITYIVAVFLFSVGFLAVQRALPYWAELGLGGDEGTVTRLMIPFILTALASYAVIPFAARRLHAKWMMIIAFVIIATGLPCMYVIAKADIGVTAKMIMAAVLFSYCGIGQGIMYVMITPMMGECIDYDEQRSGRRREALYYGLYGVFSKAGMGGSIGIACLSMSFWGNSLENPDGVFWVGPIAGLFAVCGIIILLFYPVLHVTREHADEGTTNS